MKNPLKSRHHFCWIRRVYGTQNDGSVVAGEICKTNKKKSESQIILAMMHCFQNRKKLVNREVEQVVLNTSWVEVYT